MKLSTRIGIGAIGIGVVAGVSIFALRDDPVGQETVAGILHEATQLRDVTPAGGPRTTIYEDTMPACRDCEIHVVPLAAFGSSQDSILLRDVPIVERDSRGRFYAAVPYSEDQELIVYAPNGSIERTIGRFGDGPGEFRSIRTIWIAPGDSLYVEHFGTISLFGPSGRFVRTMVLSPPVAEDIRFVGKRGDTLFVHGWLTPEEEGDPPAAGPHSRDTTSDGAPRICRSTPSTVPAASWARSGLRRSMKLGPSKRESCPFSAGRPPGTVMGDRFGWGATSGTGSRRLTSGAESFG